PGVSVFCEPLVSVALAATRPGRGGRTTGCSVDHTRSHASRTQDIHPEMSFCDGAPVVWQVCPPLPGRGTLASICIPGVRKKRSPLAMFRRSSGASKAERPIRPTDFLLTPRVAQ